MALQSSVPNSYKCTYTCIFPIFCICCQKASRSWTFVIISCDIEQDHAEIFMYLFQILLDDVKVSEQLLDLVFYSLVILCTYSKVVFPLTWIFYLYVSILTVLRIIYRYLKFSGFKWYGPFAFYSGCFQSLLIDCLYIFTMAWACSSFACILQGNILCMNSTGPSCRN